MHEHFLYQTRVEVREPGGPYTEAEMFLKFADATRGVTVKKLKEV
jgi:hypothetical protein